MTCYSRVFDKKEKKKGLKPASCHKTSNNIQHCWIQNFSKTENCLNITSKQVKVVGNLILSKFNPIPLFKLRVVWLPAKLKLENSRKYIEA